MVIRNKRQSGGEKKGKKGQIKVGKLRLNKETLKDLTNTEKKKIEGGILLRGTDAACVTWEVNLCCTDNKLKR